MFCESAGIGFLRVVGSKRTATHPCEALGGLATEARRPETESTFVPKMDATPREVAQTLGLVRAYEALGLAEV
jgi:hypothetical protein